jgi:hypothetical protein
MNEQGRLVRSEPGTWDLCTGERGHCCDVRVENGPGKHGERVCVTDQNLQIRYVHVDYLLYIVYYVL